MTSPNNVTKSHSRTQKRLYPQVPRKTAAAKGKTVLEDALLKDVTASTRQHPPAEIIRWGRTFVERINCRFSCECKSEDASQRRAHTPIGKGICETRMTTDVPSSTTWCRSRRHIEEHASTSMNLSGRLHYDTTSATISQVLYSYSLCQRMRNRCSPTARACM